LSSEQENRKKSLKVGPPGIAVGVPGGKVKVEVVCAMAVDAINTEWTT
jgi:hypothetical protein